MPCAIGRAAENDAGVMELATRRPDDRLHVFGPSPPWLLVGPSNEELTEVHFTTLAPGNALRLIGLTKALPLHSGDRPNQTEAAAIPTPRSFGYEWSIGGSDSIRSRMLRAVRSMRG